MYSLVVAVDSPVVAAESPNPNPKGRTKLRQTCSNSGGLPLSPCFLCNDANELQKKDQGFLLPTRGPKPDIE